MIQGETIAAVCDLDKNTAGDTTKEGSHTHTQAHKEKKQDVNMLSLAGN